MQRDALADVEDVAQWLAALCHRGDADSLRLQQAEKGAFIGGVSQPVHRFSRNPAHRIVFSNLPRRLEQAAGGIEAPRARGAHQVAERLQGVQQVRAAAVGNRKQLRDLRIGQVALFAGEDFEHGHRSACCRNVDGHVRLRNVE
ncbi:hypothetical protein D9M72_302740 [compost metagenome]